MSSPAELALTGKGACPPPRTNGAEPPACVAATSQTAPEPPTSAIIRLRSYTDPLTLADLFPQPQPLEVEIGSGDGGFLAAYAQAHPERNFLGIERLLGRLRKIERKAARRGLLNVRAIRLEASYVVAYLLPDTSTSAVHIYFPDPWPKRRHHARRLIQPPFVESLTRVLTPGGVVYLRTDSQDYFDQMRRAFGSASAFAETAAPDELIRFQTDFEATFQRRGVPTLRAAYQFIGASPPACPQG